MVVSLLPLADMGSGWLGGPSIPEPVVACLAQLFSHEGAPVLPHGSFALPDLIEVASLVRPVAELRSAPPRTLGERLASDPGPLEVASVHEPAVACLARHFSDQGAPVLPPGSRDLLDGKDLAALFGSVASRVISPPRPAGHSSSTHRSRTVARKASRNDELEDGGSYGRTWSRLAVVADARQNISSSQRCELQICRLTADDVHAGNGPHGRWGAKDLGRGEREVSARSADATQNLTNRSHEHRHQVISY